MSDISERLRKRQSLDADDIRATANYIEALEHEVATKKAVVIDLKSAIDTARAIIKRELEMREAAFLDYNNEKARADKAEAAVAMLQDRARRAYRFWDSDVDMKVGKILSAMGGCVGYDLELDAALGVISVTGNGKTTNAKPS